jgi:hypothetical protein
MTSASNYLEAALLNHVFRGIAMSSPATVYVALYTSDPTDADTGAEVDDDGTAYAREAVAFGAPSSGVIANTADIEWAEATGSWGTVTHVGIRDADTGGNLLAHGQLLVAKTVGVGTIFKIKAGDLTVSLD